jgi:hypothetical protein
MRRSPDAVQRAALLRRGALLIRAPSLHSMPLNGSLPSRLRQLFDLAEAVNDE